MIDISKLEKIKYQNNKIICRCPACFSEGFDRGGNHLVVYPDGKFGCCVNKDKIHYSLIFKMVGAADENIQNQENILPVEKIQIPQKFDKEILKNLKQDHSYWAGRGINLEIFNKIDAGILDLQKLKNRHTTIIFNEKNEITGFAGRSLKNNPIKWKILGPKKSFIFPRYNKKLITENQKVILVESIGDFLSLTTAGIENVLVIFGTNLSAALLNYLVAANLKKIIICTNYDENNAGQLGGDKIKNKLTQVFDSENIQIVSPRPFNDLNDALMKTGTEFVYQLFN